MVVVECYFALITMSADHSLKVKQFSVDSLKSSSPAYFVAEDFQSMMAHFRKEKVASVVQMNVCCC
jgi:hypothetical protein